MSWVVLVVVAVIAVALEIFIDNYVSDVYFKGHDAPAQKAFFIIPQVLFAILIFIIFGVDFSVAGPITFAALVGSGFIISVANVFFYRALELDDSTNVGIFNQLLPVFYLLLGWIVLGETISVLQLVAFIIILSASTLVIITARKKSRKIKFKAALYILVFVIITVIGNLIFVKANSESINFITEIAFLFLGKAMGNAAIMLFKPKWRRRYSYVMKKSHRKVVIPLVGSFLVSIISDSTYRGVLVLAPSVALGSIVVDSTEPLAIFFLGIILTLIWPKFGREKLDRKSVAVHLIATVLVTIGIILIQA